MPLSLLLMDPKELEMPSLVAQDHCWGGGNTDSRGLFYQVQTELHSTEVDLAFPLVTKFPLHVPPPLSGLFYPLRRVLTYSSCISW